MKQKFTILIGIFLIAAIVIASRGITSQSGHIPAVNYASFLGSHSSAHDTIIFDDEEFDRGMENLRVELEKLKDVDIHINLEGLDDEMKKLSEELKELKLEDLDINIEFDADKFNEIMHKLAEELKEEKFALKDFDIDMSEFKENMKSLKEEMKDLKIDLKDLDKELEKFDAFFKELKIEMKKDGLIEDEEEQIDLELNKDEMKINGEKVPDELYQKYKEMYEDYFGKELSEKSSIHIH